MISYDPQNGALSVSLTDLTTGECLLADGFAVPPMAGPFTIASGQLGKDGAQDNPAVAIGNLRTSAQYVPAGTYWRVGVNEGDTFAAYSAMNPSDALHLQLKVAGPTPRGQYRVIQSRDGVAKELSIQPQINGEIALPAASMPLGKSQLILEYSEQGQVTFTDTLNLTLGLIDIKSDDFAVDRKAQLIQGAMLISSSGPLIGISAAVEATIVEMIWDKVERNYHEEIYRREVITLARELVIPGGNRTVEFPIKIAIPDRPSLWKVSFQPIISPDVSVVANIKPVMFNTYTPAKLGLNEPYTIAVLPDTQYLAGYNPVVLNRMTQWLLEKADEDNIGLMLHVGDITDRNTADQWENAKASISN
jgi:hypothetical protein